MPVFTPKERRAHANAVGYGNAPVKPDSRFSEEQQRAYNRGVADTLNDQTMRFLLGKNSPLSEAEKQQIKAENKEMRSATPERREEIKQARQARVAASRQPRQQSAPAKGKRK